MRCVRTEDTSHTEVSLCTGFSLDLQNSICTHLISQGLLCASARKPELLSHPLITSRISIWGLCLELLWRPNPPSKKNKKHPKKSENTDTAKQKRCHAASIVTEPHTWHKKNPSIQKVSGSALYTSQYTQSEAVFGIASINNCEIRKQKRLRQKYPLGTQSFWRL